MHRDDRADGRQYHVQSGSDPTLKPSQARTWTAGLIWSPRAIKGLSITADWFDLDERNLISAIESSLILSSVERLGPASPYATFVRLGTSLAGESHFADGAAVTAPGQIGSRPADGVWVSTRLVNVAGYWQDGCDFAVNYSRNTRGWGRIDAGVAGTYIHQYVIQSLPTSDSINYAGTFFTASTYPRIRTRTRLEWSCRDWGALIGHTFIPSVTDVGSATGYHVSSYQEFDVQVSRTFPRSGGQWLRGLRLTLGVNNVFNQYPPFTPSEGMQGHDISTYDPIGRFIYASARYKF